MINNYSSDQSKWHQYTLIHQPPRYRKQPLILQLQKSGNTRNSLSFSDFCDLGPVLVSALGFHALDSGEGNGNPLQCSCLENPRDGSLVGCRLWGRTELDTDVTQQQQQQHEATWSMQFLVKSSFLLCPREQTLCSLLSGMQTAHQFFNEL